MKTEVELGMTLERFGQSGPALLDVNELIATRLLVQGNSGSGKSYLLRRLLEQSAANVQQIIIDPEGDFASLDEYGHVVIDANRSEAELVAIAERVRQQRVSCDLNLESLDIDQQMRAAATFLNALFEAPRQFWFPSLVVVDEAQLFAPAAAGDVDDAARRVSLGAMTNLMCRGRKRGLSGILATQRLAKLAKNVAAEASNFLMGRTFLDIDMARAADLLGIERSKAEMFRDLERGQFIALGPALSRRPLTVAIGPVKTQARGSTPSITPLPDKLDDEARSALLAPLPVAARAPVERRPSPVATDTQSILTDVSARAVSSEVNQAEAAPCETPEEKVAREALLHQIAAEVMGTPDAAFAQEPALFQEFQVTCRIRKATKPTLEIFRSLLPYARAGLPPEAHADVDWTGALKIASDLPDDLKAIYLLVARAAKDGQPCPSDMVLARTCGSMSPGRGRARLEKLAEQSYVTVRKDMKGNRVIGVPDFAWETAAGDPNAAAA
ncbi:DNA helicase HerA-like ATPase [Bradyrhizobium sp. USDA 4341]